MASALRGGADERASNQLIFEPRHRAVAKPHQFGNAIDANPLAERPLGLLDPVRVIERPAQCLAFNPVHAPRLDVHRRSFPLNFFPEWYRANVPNSVLPIADGVALIALNPTLVAVRLAKNFAS